MFLIIQVPVLYILQTKIAILPLFSDFESSTNPLRIPRQIPHRKVKVQSYDEQYGNISI